MSNEITGTLRNAVTASKAGIIYGDIYGDAKGRWRDGTPIRTSAVLEGPDADGIVKTLNSTYKVEFAK